MLYRTDNGYLYYQLSTPQYGWMMMATASSSARRAKHDKPTEGNSDDIRLLD
jgi:hypothetical protein